MYKFLASPASMVAVISEDCIQINRGVSPVDLDAEAAVDGVVIDDIESIFGGRLCIIYNLADMTIKALRDTESIKYMTTEPRSLLPAVAEERASLLDTICAGDERPTYRELLEALS